VDQPVALEEPVQLGKAGVAIGSTEVVDKKKPKCDRAAHRDERGPFLEKCAKDPIDWAREIGRLL
jgi:hypothetical protein